MSENTPQKPSGITSFGLDDDEPEIPVPSKEVRERAQAQAKAIGFGSESAPKKRGPKPKDRSVVATNFTVRLYPGDRERLQELAYQHRLQMADLMRNMIELYEKRGTGK